MEYNKNALHCKIKIERYHSKLLLAFSEIKTKHLHDGKSHNYKNTRSLEENQEYIIISLKYKIIMLIIKYIRECQKLFEIISEIFYEISEPYTENYNRKPNYKKGKWKCQNIFKFFKNMKKQYSDVYDLVVNSVERNADSHTGSFYQGHVLIDKKSYGIKYYQIYLIHESKQNFEIINKLSEMTNYLFENYMTVEAEITHYKNYFMPGYLVKNNKIKFAYAKMESNFEESKILEIKTLDKITLGYEIIVYLDNIYDENIKAVNDPIFVPIIKSQDQISVCLFHFHDFVNRRKIFNGIPYQDKSKIVNSTQECYKLNFNINKHSKVGLIIGKKESKEKEHKEKDLEDEISIKKYISESLENKDNLKIIKMVADNITTIEYIYNITAVDNNLIKPVMNTDEFNSFQDLKMIVINHIVNNKKQITEKEIMNVVEQIKFDDELRQTIFLKNCLQMIKD